MKQRILTLTLITCLSLPLTAQQRQEISVNAGGGFSTLLYSYGSSTQTLGGGGKVGAGYSFYFNPNWALSSGIDVGFYNTTGTLKHSVRNQNLIDMEDGADLIFTYTYSGYEEKTSAVLLTIPIMARYQTDDDKLAFYVDFGVKVGVPVSANFSADGDLRTEGFYPDLGFAFKEDMPERGFANYSGTPKTDLSLKPSFMLAVEAGVKYSITDRYSLYAGAYCDYGLNNMNKNTNNSYGALVTYQPATPANLAYGSLSGSSDRISSLALGITVRLSMSL